ncbi:IS66 family insertion sequence element accessory protein TnpB [Mesorhizobium sp. M1006]|uniref:IS66 family insertion sequence element accessory protein TnpB n=1 Tax=Mesorhizobium sp. M1006 TaxID=2957048 RepID=UPI0033358742
MRGDVKVVVARQPVEFRRGINGLIALVASALAADLYCGDIFVFRPSTATGLHLLFWDGSGMVLASKWLEYGRFTWPPIRDGSIRLTREEFALLVAGLGGTRVAKKHVKRPVRAA